VNRTLRRWLILALALTATSACASRVQETPDSPLFPAPARTVTSGLGTITGTVRDVDGRPMVGVPVTPVSLEKPPLAIPELMISSDGEGKYSWRLPPGLWSIQARGSKPIQVLLRAETSATVDLRVDHTD
jgi:hypothetical protein